MMDARTLSPQEYTAAKRKVIRDAARGVPDTVAVLERMRVKYPKLARQNDLAAWERYRSKLHDLIHAEREMQQAAADSAAAAENPSPLLRQRAADRLAAATARHDASLVEIETLHANLPPEVI